MILIEVEQPLNSCERGSYGAYAVDLSGKYVGLSSFLFR
jgi:hypothetical protein